ncbi:MAG: biotin-dependent carboxyltransferase family protein [Calditerrivibrio sp.]|nr:biotin-dependent carboxyltransferase family protein [Calditerrivibrio sp.]
MIEVLDPGFFTTVQDRGRFGFGQYGVPQSGVMDDYSYELGNILVGNSAGEAALEFTQRCGAYRFGEDAIICLTGADCGFSINDTKIRTFKTYQVRKGDLLKGETAVSGFRSYLCIKGGIDVEPELSSRSTFTRGAIGGLGGRPLRKGDLLPVKPLLSNNKVGFSLSFELLPVFNAEMIRFVPSQRNKDIEKFCRVKYYISMESDRMGIRLKYCEPCDMGGTYDTITEPTVPGTIQITNSGEPIVLMKDCQTTGGYKVLGYVIENDLSRLAQMRPHHRFYLVPVSYEESLKHFYRRRKLYKKLSVIMEIYYASRS